MNKNIVQVKILKLPKVSLCRAFQSTQLSLPIHANYTHA